MYTIMQTVSIRLTLHKGTICMEKAINGIVDVFPLGSCCSVYSMIEVLFIAIVSDQSLWKNRKDCVSKGIETVTYAGSE